MEKYAISLSLFPSLPLPLCISLCLSLHVSHTKSHTHNHTTQSHKRHPNPSLTHTHPHHTQRIQWLPRTVDTWTHFFTWEISGPPHTPTTQSGWLARLRIARMPHLHYHLEFCLRKRLIPEYVPLSLGAGVTCRYRKEDTVRLRSCYTLSVCVSFISLNDFRNPDGTQWLSPMTPNK